MKSDVVGLLLLLLILGAAFAAVAGVQVWLHQSGIGSVEPGMVLVFQVDPESEAAGRPVDMAQLLPILEKRINPGWPRRGRVQVVDPGRVEVGIAGDDAAATQRIQSLVETQGTLELRILAHPQHHGDLARRAGASNGPQVRNDANQLLAWWVPVIKGRQGILGADGELVKRSVRRDNEQVLEVLVVNDTFQVNGSYLVEAAASVNEMEQPCLNLTFNETGSSLLAGLTGANLVGPPFAGPNVAVPPPYRRLGIILDGRLHSAPAIQNVISRQAAITGGLSPGEAQDLARVLHAGALPVPLKRVELFRTAR